MGKRMKGTVTSRTRAGGVTCLLALVALHAGVSPGSLAAQERPRDGETERVTIPGGTPFSATLDQELSTRRNEVGDRFSATIDRPVISQDGRRVLVPAGATVFGEVAFAGKNDRGQRQIALRVDRLQVDGRTYPMSARITDFSEVERKGQGKGKRAAKVGGGAALGALLGKAIGGGGTGALIGAGTGALAGAAVMVATNEEHVFIEAGTVASCRIQEPVTIELRSAG